MDEQKTLHTPVDDVTLVVPEKVESYSLTNANMSTSFCSQKNRKPITVSGAMKHYGRRMKLNCRHGYSILICDDGTVSASDDDVDRHCIMEFTSERPGYVRIRGVEANLFLSMDKNGQLYGEPDPINKSTVFIEQADGPYSAYYSCSKYENDRKKWYVAIKKNGKLKLGPRTKRGQHATHFLSIAID